MPVVPDVGSTIVLPGPSTPRRSASSTTRVASLADADYRPVNPAIKIELRTGGVYGVRSWSVPSRDFVALESENLYRRRILDGELDDWRGHPGSPSRLL
jgi:hypothetical protein